MSVNATRSVGNTDKMNGYLEGYVDGQKQGMELMKIKACKVFQEMLVELCPELLGYGAIAVGWENDFKKRLEE